MAFTRKSLNNLLDSFYPLRSGLLASLYSISVVDVVNFCIATGLELTKAEEIRFLDPAKRVMAEVPDWSCPHGIRRSNCLFIGKDLCKPRTKLRQSTSIAWGQDIMKLMLIMGCSSPLDPLSAFECREPILSHFSSTFECSEMEYSGDIAVSMPELATIVYFVNPMKNSKWIESNVFTLDIRTVNLLVEPTLDGTLTCYTYPRYDGGTVDFREVHQVRCEERSFTLPGRIANKRYLFYTLLLEPCTESHSLLLFLFTLPGHTIYRRACGRWARYFRSEWLDTSPVE